MLGADNGARRCKIPPATRLSPKLTLETTQKIKTTTNRDIARKKKRHLQETRSEKRVAGGVETTGEANATTSIQEHSFATEHVENQPPVVS